MSLLLGDCFDVMRELGDCSVHAVVTDPPYGLTANKKGGSGVASVNLESPAGRSRIGTGNGAGGFMGMKWDAGVPPVEVWAECLRVLKPGGHLLAFGGPRTYHRLACAVEDAGFEIRDQIMWLFGSGFPKSHNLNGEWDGWGTALKPAHEPIVVARKPLAGTVAANVLEHGAGALNIDGCRVEVGSETVAAGSKNLASWRRKEGREDFPQRPPAVREEGLGRWPANVIHDGSDEVVAAFPDDTGQQAALTTRGSDRTRNVFGTFAGTPEAHFAPHDAKGNAARFFYCAKASRADRNEGCEEMPARKVHPPSGDGRCWDIPGSNSTPRSNHHPTVKPTDLMRYLCRLVTPPGGIVLDPFMGSGSTGKAAALEGFGFIGIEIDPDYMAIAEARIAHVTRQQRLFA